MFVIRKCISVQLFNIKTLLFPKSVPLNSLVLSLPIDVTSGSKVNDAESKTGQVQLLTSMSC